MPAQRTDRRRTGQRWTRWFALLLSVGLLVAGTAACDPNNSTDASNSANAASARDTHGQRGHDRSSAPAAPKSSAPAPSSSSFPICGTPPCDKYLSRSQTHNIDADIAAHSLASEIALHLVVGLVCGGFLCDWGAGLTYDYVKAQIHQAAQNDECLRVRIFPHDGSRQLVQLVPTNQSPYCTN
jgi:hypothetical protein